MGKTGSWPMALPSAPPVPTHGANPPVFYRWMGPATRINGYRRRRIMSVLPPVKCGRRRQTNGEPCSSYAVLGTTVCRKHGGSSPQVKAVAERRVMLAEAIANLPRRHPYEVMGDALHVTDVAGQQLLAAITDGLPVTAEVVSTLLEAARSQAGLAKLVLDATGGDAWTAQEVNRRFGDTVAEICREMARQLGHDPAGEETSAAFEAALARVVYGKRGRKAIGGSK